jgi:hypothetical protein
MYDVDEIVSELEPANPMVEAVRGAFGSLFGFQPKRPISPLVNWIVDTAALPRNQVDNFVRAHRNDPGVVRAINGDEASRCIIMKEIALALGIDIFNDAFTVPEILDAARINASRPMDEAAGVSGKPLVEHVEYRKGHKNSQGEDAPWVIVSCQTGKILSSHKSKEKAEEHLGQMEYFKHKK